MMTPDASTISDVVWGTSSARHANDTDNLPWIVLNRSAEITLQTMCRDIYQNHTCSEDSVAHFVQAALGLVSFLLIVIGNGLTILVIVTDRQLHNVSFLVILNLAVGDFLIGVISQPPSVYYTLTCIWPKGSEGFLCQFVGFSICLLCSVSILSLGFVSYERYVYVVFPFEYKTKLTFRRGVLICFALWVYATVAALFPISGLWKGVGLIPDTALCNVLWHVESVYMWLMILMIFLPSVVVITYSYYKILIMVRTMNRLETRYRRAINMNYPHTKNSSSRLTQGTVYTPDSTPDTASLNGTAPQTPVSMRKVSIGNARKVAKVFVKEQKSSITVTLLLGTFVVCWTPYVIVHIIQAMQCEPLTFWESYVPQWLCIFNSGCNPIVYGVSNRVFRQAVKRFFRRLGICSKQPTQGDSIGTPMRALPQPRERETQKVNSQEELDTLV